LGGEKNKIFERHMRKKGRVWGCIWEIKGLREGGFSKGGKKTGIECPNKGMSTFLKSREVGKGFSLFSVGGGGKGLGTAGKKRCSPKKEKSQR